MHRHRHTGLVTFRAALWHPAIGISRGISLMHFPSMVTIAPMLWGSSKRSGVLILALPVLLTACSLPWVDRSIPLPLPVPEDGSAPVAENLVEETSPKTHSSQLSVAAANDTWERLAREFGWPEFTDSGVTAALRSFTERREDFQRASERAEPFLWFIAEALAARKLPAELALLPLVESGFRVSARSRRGAVGLWQFMPTTGQRFHLKQTNWYDARRDVVASTHAALNYLALLHRRFDGNWLLAVAAYNCGPAAVGRAVAKNGSHDFWVVGADLPAETRQYVRRLLAAIAIVNDPASYGVVLHPIANAQYFSEIDLGGPADLEYLTQVDGWSETEFKQLNAAFKRGYADPDGPFRILAPLALSARIGAAVAALPPEARRPSRIHLVESGDTLAEIAMRYGVGITTIRRQNNIRGDFIRVGAELVVRMPASGDRGERLDPSVPRGDRHMVQPGESFWTVARKYGTTGRIVAALNRLSLKDTLYPGQILIIRQSLKAGRYAVVPGDSLWTIARRFNVSIDQLRQWNNLPLRESLQPGQSLIVSSPPAAKVKKT
ncbi:MAG: LysM peptidoglycan-binding domain-containing protein [Gammaproteobacteria bacterium]|nr:LysM peptidoglycan-binding domain-containing protein [Gammaproteobacteria bacterium]